MASYPPYTIDDIMVDLSYALGEQSVPTSGVDDRKVYIQRALEEAHRYARWDWAKANVTLTITAGIVSLPTMTQLSPDLDIRIKGSGQGDDQIFSQVPYEEQDEFGQGDYKYWLTGQVGAYVANTTEPSGVVTLRADQLAADLLNSGSTYFPSSRVLAQGALRYYRASRDPDYDVAQDEAIWQKGLNDLLGLQNANGPIMRAKGRAEVRGMANTGEIG